MRYAHTPRGQPPRSEDMRSCAEGWQVPEALSLLGGPLLRLLQMRLQGRQGRARKGGDRRVVPLLGVCLAQCTPTGATSVTPVYLSGPLCHKVERALIRALLFALPPLGGVFAPGGRPAVFARLHTADHRRLASPVQEDQDAPAPYPFTGHGSCGSPWSSRKLPLPW